MPSPCTLTKTDDTQSGASFGYASDGRMKPELCHAYFDIFTTSEGPAAYTEFNGTIGQYVEEVTKIPQVKPGNYYMHVVSPPDCEWTVTFTSP